MAIQMSCPGCQKSYMFPDDKRGKQVRCRDCSHVFRVGKLSANAPSAPEPREAEMEPDAVPTRAPKATAKPQSIAPARSAAKSAPRSRPAAAVKAGVADDRPTTAGSRRRTVVWIVALAAGLLLLLFGGGGIVVVVVLWRLGKPADTPVVAGPAAPAPTANPGDGAPPKTDKTEPPKPDKTEPPKPAGTGNYWESFYKIDKGMSMDDVVALLGPPATTQKLDDPAKFPGLDTRLIYEPEPRLKLIVDMFQGKVVKKINSGNRPNVYPSDVAQNPPPGKNPQTGGTPPPDKPPPTPKVQVTQDLFNMVDLGMTMDQVVAVAGKPKMVLDLRLGNYPNLDTELWYDNGTLSDVGMKVEMYQGKVTGKLGWSGKQKWPVVYPSGGGAAPPAKPAGALTRDSFDKIDKGMSMDDVVALLGQPTATVKLDPAKFGGVDTEMTFINLGVNTNAAATVDLFQGKVVKKSNPQSWPVAYPSDKAK